MSHQLPLPRKNKQDFASLVRFSYSQYLLVDAFPSRRSLDFKAAKLSCSNLTLAKTWFHQLGRISQSVFSQCITLLFNRIVPR